MNETSKPIRCWVPIHSGLMMSVTTPMGLGRIRLHVESWMTLAWEGLCSGDDAVHAHQSDFPGSDRTSSHSVSPHSPLMSLPLLHRPRYVLGSDFASLAAARRGDERSWRLVGLEKVGAGDWSQVAMQMPVFLPLYMHNEAHHLDSYLAPCQLPCLSHCRNRRRSRCQWLRLSARFQACMAIT